MSEFILTKENYFSPEASQLFCGSTQFKDFVPELGGCEARAMASIRGEYQRKVSTDMLFGKAVHAWSEGTLSEFKKENPELYLKDGVTFQQKYRGIQDCIDTIENDASMMMVLKGQKEVIVTANMFGMDWKIMIDVYAPDGGFFTDLKCMRDFEFKWSPHVGRKVSFIEYWGYEYQMAIYAEVERIATGRDEWLFPHIAAVTKQDPPDKGVFIGFMEQIPRLLDEIRQYSPRIIELKSGQAQPLYCDRNDCEYCRKVRPAKFIDYTTWVPVEADEV